MSDTKSGEENIPSELLEALKKMESSPPEKRKATFGIGKTVGGAIGMQRTVVHFTQPPKSYPLSLYCSLPGGFIGHRFLLDMLKEKLSCVTTVDVTTPTVTYIQFQDRNVILGTQGLLNRWIITVNCVEARDELLRAGLFILNKKVGLKRYDDILAAEYREFKDYMAAQKKLFAKLEASNVAETTEAFSKVGDKRKAKVCKGDASSVKHSSSEKRNGKEEHEVKNDKTHEIKGSEEQNQSEANDYIKRMEITEENHDDDHNDDDDGDDDDSDNDNNQNSRGQTDADEDDEMSA